MTIRRFTARDGKLFLGANTELTPAGNGAFTTGATTIRFAGNGATLTPAAGLPEAMVRVDDVHLDNAALQAFVGAYSSPELGVTWRIARDEGKLRLIRPDSALSLKDDEQELLPITRDVFAVGGIVFRFERADSGVSGFVIGLGRMRGMKFERARLAS